MPSLVSRAAAALAHARRGWPVFPLHTPRDEGCSCGKPCGKNAGKHPRIKGWQAEATTDERQVRRWWRQWPDANIGMPTGRPDTFTILDVDPRDGGDDSLFELERKHGKIPATVEVVTGGLGRQLYFKPVPGLRNSAKRIAPGLDVRGEGGLVVLPDSLHRSGREYHFEGSSDPDEGVTAAVMSEWLVGLARGAMDLPREPHAPRGEEGQSAPLAPVWEGCAWLRHCVEAAESLGEQEWYAMLTIAARLENGERLAQEWSRPHPDYDGEATADKLAHASRNTGPFRCASIRAIGGEEFCASCLHWERIKSPVSLGRGKLAALEPPPESHRISAEDGSLPQNGAPPSPIGGDPFEETPPSNGRHAGAAEPAAAEPPAPLPEDPPSERGETKKREKKPAAEKTPDSSPREPAEMLLAKRWAEETAGQLAFFEGAQWYRYSLGRWTYSSAETAEARLQHWLETNRKKFPGLTVTARKVSNVLRLARNLLGPHEIAELDAHPTWIPLRNGVYDTERGVLLPHDPAHFLTSQLPFDYLPEARCARWEEFAQQVLLTVDGEPCEEWILALQEWFGYCLVPDSSAQVAMVWVGEGRNGKGVASRTLEAMVGRENCTAVPIEQLHDPYHRAELHGKLVGFVNEPDPRAMSKNGAHFKAISAGDAISARRPTEKVFTFVPVCRLVISTNAMPGTRDLSQGYFRRLLVMEWRLQITDETAVDPFLDRKLHAELPGIFNWALVGLRRFRDRGSRFAALAESDRLLQEYRIGEDTVAQFLRQECETAPEYEVPMKRLFAAYGRWCKDNGYPVSQVGNVVSVGKRLDRLGLVRKRHTRVSGIDTRIRMGLRLRPDSDYAESAGLLGLPPPEEGGRLSYAG